MEHLVADLMAQLHPPLSKPLTDGVEVETPRGRGIVVGKCGDGLADFGYGVGSAQYRPTTFVIVELDGDGVRAHFRPRDLQVVDSG